MTDENKPVSKKSAKEEERQKKLNAIPTSLSSIDGYPPAQRTQAQQRTPQMGKMEIHAQS